MIKLVRNLVVLSFLLFSYLGLASCSFSQSTFNSEFQLSEQQINPLRCELKPQTGHCKAAFTKYYFNNHTQRCEQFIWGGCGGTVPFENLTSCQRSCEKP